MKRRKLLTALFLLLAVCALALGIAAVRRAQRLPSSAGVRVPVLMYHAVGAEMCIRDRATTAGARKVCS